MQIEVRESMKMFFFDSGSGQQLTMSSIKHFMLSLLYDRYFYI